MTQNFLDFLNHQPNCVLAPSALIGGTPFSTSSGPHSRAAARAANPSNSARPGSASAKAYISEQEMASRGKGRVAGIWADMGRGMGIGMGRKQAHGDTQLGMLPTERPAALTEGVLGWTQPLLA